MGISDDTAPSVDQAEDYNAISMIESTQGTIGCR